MEIEKLRNLRAKQRASQKAKLSEQSWNRVVVIQRLLTFIYQLDGVSFEELQERRTELRLALTENEVERLYEDTWKEFNKLKEDL